MTDRTPEERVKIVNSSEYRQAEIIQFHLTMQQVEARTVGDNVDTTIYLMEQIRAAVEAARRERDIQWSASLESGYSDAPPRDPEDIGRWWKFIVSEIQSSARREERDKMLAQGGISPFALEALGDAD